MIAAAAEPLILPKGYGFRSLTGRELREKGTLKDCLLLFEPPRRRGRYSYVIGADVSDGLGRDGSCAQVIRVGTLDEPEEQVAEYLSADVAPGAFAYTLQALGQYYRDHDGVEAKIAVEYTHHGLSTIDTLHLHLGYTNQYRWEYFDAADASSRFGTMYGWHTTPRTRPVMVDKLRTALLTLDPITNLPDLITHSPRLHEELRDFQTDGALWEAAAARGAHDDCVMAIAIAHIVAWRLQAGETEPLEERRRRKSEQVAQLQLASEGYIKPDFRNCPAAADDQSRWGAGTHSPEEQEDLDEQLYDLRAYEEVPY
jgi:hypothetical protein